MVRPFKIDSNTLLLTIVAMLYIKSSELTHLVTRSLHPLTNLSPFLLPPAPLSLNSALLEVIYT